MEPRFRVRLLLLMLLVGCGRGEVSVPVTIEWRPCELPGVGESARCATVEVPENAGDPDTRRIGLNLVVLPATGPEAAPDALTFLAGGGVVPATNYAGFIARALPRVRETRDIMLVDQRGTGRSNPLHCELPEDPPEERTRALAECLDVLSDRADPRFYTTPHAMDDLESIRRELGYEQLTVWGVSYGTKAARVYARRHPQRVRALVLHGTIPIARSMWLDLPESERLYLDRLLDRCAADARCAGAFPGIHEAYMALIERLEHEPVTIESTGETMDADRFRRRLYGSLRSMRLAAGVPAVINRAAAGNFTDFESGPPGALPPVPRGVYLSIACSEELARLEPAEIATARAAMPSTGRARFDRDLTDCAGWPTGSVPQTYWQPLESDLPVLLLAGEEDYITPPAYAEAAAQTLARSTVLRLPGRSHDDFDPCLGQIIQDFVLAGDAEELDTSCLERDPFPPFVVD